MYLICVLICLKNIRIYVLICFSDKCSWTIKASCRKKSDIFIVRNFNSEHTCPMRERLLTKVQATVGFVSGVTAPKLVNYKRIYTPRDIIDDFENIMGLKYLTSKHGVLKNVHSP